MLTDLTLHVELNNPVMTWAKAQKSPHLAMGHVGTHLDTYNKSTIPLEYFKSRSLVFDVRHTDEVQLSDLDLSLIEPGDFVLFRTGQMERYKFGDKEYFTDHPQLADAVIDALLAKKIRFIGIDSPGIRRHAQHEQADRKCEAGGIYVIENLTNLQHLPCQAFTIYTMWLDDELMTGLKCRVLAEY